MKQRTDFFKRVYRIVERIPYGKVTTYGRIAERLGLRVSARFVGWALHSALEGLPCHRVVNRFGALSGKYAFGVRVNGGSLLNFGDMSVLSFHATKVYTTFEGGTIVCHDEQTRREINFLKNFGYMDETTVITPGINAKLNEFQAALGLLQLRHVDGAIRKREEIARMYRNELRSLDGITFFNEIENVQHNFSHFLIFVRNKGNTSVRDELYKELKKQNIFTRRYFYPFISRLPFYKDLASADMKNLPIVERISVEVLCLPIFHGLSEDNIRKIVSTIKASVL